MVRVLARVRGTSQAELSASWYGLTWRRAAQPRRSPTTSYPSSSIRQTNCWMAAFKPGTSPPPVRMPTRLVIAAPPALQSSHRHQPVDQVRHPVRVPPLVVVPGHDLDVAVA